MCMGVKDEVLLDWVGVLLCIKYKVSSANGLMGSDCGSGLSDMNFGYIFIQVGNLLNFLVSPYVKNLADLQCACYTSHG